MPPRWLKTKGDVWWVNSHWYLKLGTLCGHLLLWALVSSVVSSSTQVQGLAACGAAAFSRGGGGGFCCLCYLDALCCHRFFFIFELQVFLPPVSWCAILLIVTMATRQKNKRKSPSHPPGWYVPVLFSSSGPVPEAWEVWGYIYLRGSPQISLFLLGSGLYPGVLFFQESILAF